MLLMGHQRVLRKIGAYEYGRPEETPVSKQAPATKQAPSSKTSGVS
jgi:hypothetical protein